MNPNYHALLSDIVAVESSKPNTDPVSDRSKTTLSSQVSRWDLETSSEPFKISARIINGLCSILCKKFHMPCIVSSHHGCCKSIHLIVFQGQRVWKVTNITHRRRPLFIHSIGQGSSRRIALVSQTSMECPIIKQQYLALL